MIKDLVFVGDTDMLSQSVKSPLTRVMTVMRR